MLTLSQVLQKGLSDLGRTDTFLASAGTKSTIVRAGLNAMAVQPPDNYAVGFSVFVAKTTDGLAPQGQFGSVIGYDSGTFTYTLGADLTEVVGAGDKIIIADSLFPLQECTERVNRGLEKLGEILVADVSLTTAANQTEYSLPAQIIRRPYLVEIQTVTNDANDNRYVPVSDWDISPLEQSGVTFTGPFLIFESQPPAGRKLKVWYGGLHYTLVAWDDEISSVIHPALSVALFVEAALEWFVGRVGGSRANAFWVQRWNDAKRNAAIAEAKFPVPKPDTQDKYFEIGGYPCDPNEGYYVV